MEHKLLEKNVWNMIASGSLNDSLDNIKDAIIGLDTVGPGEAIITIENQ